MQDKYNQKYNKIKRNDKNSKINVIDARWNLNIDITLKQIIEEG